MNHPNHDLIKNLPGPVLVIGASGFIGANLMRRLLRLRPDVHGTYYSNSPWRLQGLPTSNLIYFDLADPDGVREIMDQIRPQVIFDCSAFGAYSFESDPGRIHRTNYLGFIQFMEILAEYELTAYIHAGSSSEYGDNAAGPDEDDPLKPNSHYAVSKAAVSQAIYFYGHTRGLPVANLRLYSVYGPYEDSSRLIPVLCEQAQKGLLPPLASPETSRDFIHVDDAAEAFFAAALRMGPAVAGESFNIGSGTRTTLAELAELARDVFRIETEPTFSPLENRAWDVPRWYADPAKAARVLGWKAAVGLKEGLESTGRWWREFTRDNDFSALTKKRRPAGTKNSVSAIVACYKDEQAIPIMYERLVKVFTDLEIDYEIIFVNDCSPDNSQEVIQALSHKDHRVVGINHSRNFGSQAAFRSGMEIAAKEACVLMDGDLQDPPEVIPEFIRAWREGAEVVYGRRIKREMPVWREWLYKLFYRILATLSEFKIPKDAGDFSLIDRTAWRWILKCRERDNFLRGLRAYVGFRQRAVDYERPERMFGRSTNNWIKNIGWAKKAIFSFSRAPLHLLTAVGGVAFVCSVVFGLANVAMRLLAADHVPAGLTTVIILIMIFGSATLLGLGLLGEYIGKIFEETKARPPFIRQSIIRNGQEFAADGLIALTDQDDD